MQAGGHGFESRWLHSQKGLHGSRFRELSSLSRGGAWRLVIRFGHQTACRALCETRGTQLGDNVDDRFPCIRGVRADAESMCQGARASDDASPLEPDVGAGVLASALSAARLTSAEM